MDSKLEQIFNNQVKFYNIKIEPKRFRKPTYRVWIDEKRIKVSVIKDEMSFLYAMLAVGYIAVGKNTTPRYKSDYLALKWAINTAKHYGIENPKFEEEMRGIILISVAKGHNRSGDISNIPEEIKKFLFTIEPDFNSWRGNKVFYDFYKKTLTKTPNDDLFKKEIVRKRKRINKDFNE